jgi:molecular chaperone GrpE
VTQEKTQDQTPSPEAEVANGEIPRIDDVEPVDELAKVSAERDDYLDQLQRSRAEFINFRRRNDQERAALRQYVTRDVVASFLPVVDDLERALGALPDDERESGWVKGVEMIQAKLDATFERLGITKLEALGADFDPAVHEAVATQPGSSGSTVVEVYQPGYRIGELLVRPAMVMTGDPAPQDEATTATFSA